MWVRWGRRAFRVLRALARVILFLDHRVHKERTARQAQKALQDLLAPPAPTVCPAPLDPKEIEAIRVHLAQQAFLAQWDHRDQPVQ